MRIKDIANKYNFKLADFERFLRQSGANLKFGITGTIVEGDIEEHVKNYLIFQKEEQEKRKQEEIQKELELQKAKELEEKKIEQEENKKRAMANMLITSGFTFDGYKIVKYSGYISGDDSISISRGRDGIFSRPTDVGSILTEALAHIRREAIKELKEAAYNLGCNAVIGVDFDYLTLDPETVNSGGGTLYLPYVFCVTANGNAVIIEEIDN